MVWAPHEEGLDQLPDEWSKPVKTEPEEWFAFIWRGWHRLNRSRNYLAGGMSAPVPMPIAWEQIDHYCQRFGYEAHVYKLFELCVIKMDETYLELSAKKRDDGEQLLPDAEVDDQDGP